MGRAAGSAVLSYLLGGAGDRVGQHHGLADGCAGSLRLWPGHGQPASGQAQRTEGEEAERTWWEGEMGIGMARIWVEKGLTLSFFGKIILVTLQLSLIFSYIWLFCVIVNLINFGYLTWHINCPTSINQCALLSAVVSFLKLPLVVAKVTHVQILHIGASSVHLTVSSC